MMNTSITIVTFIRGNENHNTSIEKLNDSLKHFFPLTNLIEYTDHSNDNRGPNEIYSPDTTKYNRIKDSLIQSDSDFLLFVDNDITPDNNIVVSFVQDFISSNKSIGWGKINTINDNGLICRIIRIDKNVSHNIIRPILWRLSLGVSVPGQMVILNRKTFLNKLVITDTVFDDLTIGAYVIINKIGYFYSNKTLGSEEPSTTLSQLLSQRKRWAYGYMQTIKNFKDTPAFYRILLHGIAYHCLPIIFSICLLYLLLTHPCIGVILFLCSARCISMRMSDIPIGILYILLFPAVHLFWQYHVVSELIKSNV